MGMHPKINHELFPSQSDKVGTKGEHGKIVRDDTESPFVCIEVAGEDADPIVYVNGIAPQREQGKYRLRQANVCFWYDTSHMRKGRIVRDDVYLEEEDDKCYEVFQLEDGRYVLSVECMYQPYL
jgi:hypothetical protein